MEAKACTSDHTQHICALAEQQKHGEIKKLAGNPKYMCSNCGRVAKQGKNLCNPLPFDMIAPGIPLE
jgi:hypothetical protein